MRHILWIFVALWLTACGNQSGKEIAKIPEASGISYCSHSDTLIVANDEGSYYEISKEGKILSENKLGKYDLEGVVCEDDTLFFALENEGILVVNRKTGVKHKVIVDDFYGVKKRSLFGKKSGVEGIAKVGDAVYLAKQSKKKEDSFVAIVKLMPHSGKVVDIIEHRVADTSGLTYHDGVLYMVSDKEDMLIKYDLEKKEIIQKITLKKGAWEGIAFDNEGYVYLADDEGRIVKYKKKTLNL